MNNLEYIAEYQKKNYKQVKINLNFESDKELIEKLESVPNKQGYIKNLIREDIKWKEAPIWCFSFLHILTEKLNDNIL